MTVLQIVDASCATAPPAGGTCVDTAVIAGGTPSWLPLVILAVIVAVVVVTAFVRTSSRFRR
ncbi:hypothetical protein [Leifsonia sp. P73]|uniref:hypothetical protein n=1 Tax=Leifsonia sp. P73 TaxID=3423959 RepID=UPI003DA3DC04